MLTCHALLCITGCTSGSSNVVDSILQLFLLPALPSLLAANLLALWVCDYAAAIV